MITKEYLCEILDYNPETGVFIWKERPGDDENTRARNAHYAGKEAGYIEKVSGQRMIYVNRRQHFARRLAYIIMTGKPSTTKAIAHDGDKTNLAWDNIHHPEKKEEKHPGVRYDYFVRKWYAQLDVEIATFHLGEFPEQADAVNARNRKIKELEINYV